MDFTSTEIIAIIVAVGAVAVQIITAVRTGNKVESIALVTAKSLVETTALQGQVKEVHTLTNSNLSEVKAELRQSAAELAALKDVVSDLKLQRTNAALTTALNTPSPAQVKSSEDEFMNVKIIADEPVPVAVQEIVTKEPTPIKKLPKT